MSHDVTVKSAAADRLAAMLLLHSSMVGRRKAGKWSSFHCGMRLQMRSGNENKRSNNSNSNSDIRRRTFEVQKLLRLLST